MKQTYKDLHQLAAITIEEAELKADYSIVDRKLKNSIVDSVAMLLFKFQDVKERHK